jgi:hypothetical protein
MKFDMEDEMAAPAEEAGPPDMAELSALLSDLSAQIAGIQARMPQAAPEEAPMLEDEAEAPLDAPAEDDEKALAKGRASAMLSKLA